MNAARTIRNALYYLDDFRNSTIFIKFDNAIARDIERTPIIKDLATIGRHINWKVFLAFDKSYFKTFHKLVRFHDNPPFNLCQLKKEDSDLEAAEFAIKKKAQKLIYVTSFDGLFDKEHHLIHQTDIPGLDTLIENEIATGSALTKLRAAQLALRSGVSRVHIISGTEERANSLLLELFTSEGVGTMICSNLYQACSWAKQEHIPDISRILNEGSFSFKTSFLELAQTLENYLVFCVDGEVCGCIRLTHLGESEVHVGAIAVQNIYDDFNALGQLLICAMREAKFLGADKLVINLENCPTWLAINPEFTSLGFSRKGTTNNWVKNLKEA